ncbi:phospholipid-binding lipoprotein MlaA [Roseomonas rosea]|uniref:Phospholipid-binding lipoprotein MlaA n=1 Tax=Muricoccus roseus TaxID=198092 RepID=A0A1M6S824_9PROT|nr:VacJ family lipoprotein [Roseomonas rosea]SHK40954.1 phospholipid-binding lipoprotein MlaA [Roseomonas rosea]
MRLPRSPLPRLLAATLALGLLGGALSGCATRPPADDPEALEEFRATNDPIEPWNRAMYDVHQAIDTVVLRPVAVAYRAVLPQPVRTGVSNVLSNLRSPVIALNDALQGETQRFGTTLGRFLLNTTLGVGGIFDVASDLGLPPHTEDFGQTFAMAGVEEGPYLFIPLLGPSNPRDLLGFAAGIAADPFTYLTFGNRDLADTLYLIRAGATVVSTRESLLDTLDDVQRTSLDPYATLRSAYRQQRAREIANTPGAAPAAPQGLGSGLGSTGPEPRQP